MPDRTTADAATADSSTADSSTTDGAQPDRAAPDANQPDAGSIDSGVSASLCGTTSVIQDGFNDGAIGIDWWYYDHGDASILEGGGDLRVELPGGVDEAWAGLISVGAVDLRGDALKVEVTLSAVLPGTNFFLEHYLEESNLLQISCSDQRLTARAVVDDVVETNSLPYDGNAHRWWRIREHGGRVFFEHSPDGQTWSVLLEIQTPPSAAAAYIGLGGGHTTRPQTGLDGRFDNLNIDAPVTPWCPASSCQDDFNDTQLSLLWLLTDPDNCAVVEQDGELWLTATPTDADCDLITRRLHLLDEVSVQVVETTAAAGTYAGIDAYDERAGEFGCSLGLGGGQLVAWVNGTPPFEHVEAAAGRSWIRLRQEPGQLMFDASADGVSWENVFEYELSAPLPPLRLALTAECAGCQVTSFEAVFDNYNLLP